MVVDWRWGGRSRAGDEEYIVSKMIMFWMMNHGNKKRITLPVGRVRTVIYCPIILATT